MDKLDIKQIKNIEKSVTKTELDVLVTNSRLITGAYYKVTNRGHLGLILQAASPNSFYLNTIFIFCTVNYSTYNIWDSLTTYNVNDVVIWGNKYWKNLNGNAGTSIDSLLLDTSEWILLAYTDPLYKSNNYSCDYNYETDKYITIMDNHNNIFDSTTSNNYMKFKWGTNTISSNNIIESDIEICNIPNVAFNGNNITNAIITSNTIDTIDLNYNILNQTLITSCTINTLTILNNNGNGLTLSVSTFDQCSIEYNDINILNIDSCNANTFFQLVYNTLNTCYFRDVTFINAIIQYSEYTNAYNDNVTIGGTYSRVISKKSYDTIAGLTFSHTADFNSSISRYRSLTENSRLEQNISEFKFINDKTSLDAFIFGSTGSIKFGGLSGSSNRIVYADSAGYIHAANPLAATNYATFSATFSAGDTKTFTHNFNDLVYTIDLYNSVTNTEVYGSYVRNLNTVDITLSGSFSEISTNIILS